MCGRFLLEADIEDLLKYYNIASGSVTSVPQRMVFPKQSAPAVIMHENALRLGLLSWGFSTAKSATPIINGRSETIAEKPLFKVPFLKRRCVVPATAYYEWTPAKSPFTYYPKDLALLSLAGVYTKGDDGVWRFALLTREATGDATLVHNRMPQVIQKDDLAKWLSVDTPLEDVKALLKPKEVPLHILPGILENTR